MQHDININKKTSLYVQKYIDSFNKVKVVEKFEIQLNFKK